VEKEGGVFYFFMHRTFHNYGKRKTLIVMAIKLILIRPNYSEIENLKKEIIKIYKGNKELNFYETKLIGGGGRIV